MDVFEIARSKGWLAEQPEDSQKAILSRCIVRHYSSGEAVTRYGDPSDGVYALIKGILKLELALQDDFRLAASKHPVCWFGQAACLRKKSFLVSLTASTPVTLLFLPIAEFESLLENARFCRSFALLTVDHYEEAIQAIAPLLINDTKSKVITRLAQLALHSGHELPAVLRISQADLAEMCGVSRSTTFSICNELQELGLIKTGYRQIEVKDPEALLNFQVKVSEAA